MGNLSTRLSSSFCLNPHRLTATPDAALSRSLDLSLTGKRSCAVVGSSDLLRISPPQGTAIDAHDLIFRLNNAPTASFEHIAGARTSFRVINHVPIEKWVLRATNHSALRRTVDGAEYEALLCQPDGAALEAACVLSLVNSGKHFTQTVGAYRALYPTHRLLQLSGALQRLGSRCTSLLGGTSPSGGFLAVLLALSVCEPPVSLYGFWPFCCRPHRGLPRMNYKYSQGNRTAFVCCSPGREKMELEFALYERLQRHGLVALHTAPALDWGGVRVGTSTKSMSAVASAAERSGRTRPSTGPSTVQARHRTNSMAMETASARRRWSSKSTHSRPHIARSSSVSPTALG